MLEKKEYPIVSCYEELEKFMSLDNWSATFILYSIPVATSQVFLLNHSILVYCNYT